MIRPAEVSDVKEFRMEIFFGQRDCPALADVARQVFETFQAPLLKVYLAELLHANRIVSPEADAVIKDQLYRSIMEEFVRRLDLRHNQNR